MAMILMIENINNDISTYATGKTDVSPGGGNYYKFYQSKLRQLITQTRYRKEQDARLARQKAKVPTQDNQRLHKEYMNNIRERVKVSTQENYTNKLDDRRKSMENMIVNTSRTPTLSIISTSIESRPKSIVKARANSIPPKQQRIISAPIASQRSVNKPKTPATTIIEDNLSKANIHSFTQVSSSSNQNPNDETSRQSILGTIYSHLNSHYPSSVAMWPTFEEIDNKFSMSIAPNVYQNFERNNV